MSDVGSLIFYYFIFFITSCFFLIGKLRNNKSRYIWLFISVLITAIISGLRFNVGIDYNRYYELFYIIKSTAMDDLSKGIPGFNVDRSFLFISKFFLNFCGVRTYFALLTFITVGLIVVSLVDEQYEQYDATLAYFLYLVVYFGESLNNIRQFVAISIVFYSLKYVFKKKLKSFLLCVLIASCFHISAFLILPVYVFWNKKGNNTIKKEYFIIPISVALFFVINWERIIKVLNQCGILTPLRTALYSTSSAQTNREFYIKLVIMIIIICFFKYFEDDKKAKLFAYMFIVGVVLSVVGFQVGHLKRVAYYYDISLILLLPYVQRFFINNGSRYVYKYLVIFSSIGYFALNYYVLKHSALIPYQFFIQ